MSIEEEEEEEEEDKTYSHLRNSLAACSDHSF
jgi:hypothetical protein